MKNIYLQLKNWFLKQYRLKILRRAILWSTRSHSKIIEVHNVTHLLKESMTIKLINELAKLNYVSFDEDIITENSVLKFVGKPTWWERKRYNIYWK